MRRVSVTILVAGILGACEEGPEQIYQPNPPNIDVSRFNGWRPVAFVATGDQPFTSTSSGQKTGTVKLCEADELAKRWSKMVKEPIVPTQGAGGINLKGNPVWSGLTIDQAQQQLCQAEVLGDGVVYWGDNAELIAWYDTTTRLLDRVATLTGYEGTLSAGPFEIANNKEIMKDGKPISDPTADTVLRAMNIEFLKKFRPEVKNPESRDCVALSTCYVMSWYTLKRFVFNDLEIDFAVEPEGRIDHIGINLKRSFEFTKNDVKFETTPMPTAGLPPMPKIAASATCQPTLGQTWDHIRSNCLGLDPEAKALAQPVWSNEGIFVDMGGLGVYMTRNMPVDQIIPNDTKAAPTDSIVGLSFNTSYEGRLLISRTNLLKAFFAGVVARVTGAVTTQGAEIETALTDAFAKITPVGDGTKLAVGTQKIQDCTSSPCVEATLTIRTREIVQSTVQKLAGSVPDTLKDPNFYVEVWLTELLTIFNEGKAPTSSELYLYVGDETAQVMYGRLARRINGERYAVTVAYHNLSDQILVIFFRKGMIRPEKILYRDAELDKKNSPTKDGVFRLWDLAMSPRLGLAVQNFLPKQVDDAARKTLDDMRKTILTVNLDQPTDILVNHHAAGGLSGFSIPLEGQRDVFVPADYYGFSGNVIGASIWATKGIVRAVSSGTFYDKLDFCGVKVGLWDSAAELLQKVPLSCETIVSYSENGKMMTAVSTYVQQTPYKIGLRLWITAGRIDAGYYWAEE
jgi:hypothetical protein